VTPEDGPANPPAGARRALAAEDLAWLATIAGALVLAVVFLWLTTALAKLYPTPTLHVFKVWQVLIDPEPREDARSIVTLGLPFVVAAVVLAFGSTRPPRRSLDPVVIAAQAVAFIALTWAVLNQTRSGPLLLPHYFDPLLLSLPGLAAGACLGLLMTGAILWRPALRLPEWVGRLAQWLRGRLWIPLGLAVLATVLWLLPAVITDSTLAHSGGLASGHIPVQSEDYWAVVNGRTPLIDYIAQYANLLPIVVAPVLGAFHSSITSYSITMCVLSTVGMVAIFGVLTVVTRRPWVALGLYVPWVALSLFPWNDIGPYREFTGIYYAVLPGRYIGPFLLALLLAVSTRRRIPTMAMFGFAGLVVLNNYEFGIGALIGLTAAMIAAWDRTVPFGRRLAVLIGDGTAGLLAALVLVSAFTLIRTGELPDLSLLSYFDRLFLRDSYGLQSMPSLGLHWALYATYVAALLLATIRYVRRDPDVTLTAMLAFSGVFGLATGMYFVGRSAQFQLMMLFPAWGLALALLAWTAIGSLGSARLDRLRLRRLLIPACVALIGLGVMIAAIARVPPPWRQVSRLENGGPPIAGLDNAVRYVEAHTQPGEHVLIIGTPLDHRVADLAGVVNVSPINGVTSLVSAKEADRALDQLEDEGGHQVIDGVSGLPEGGLVFGIPEFATILRERGYRLVNEQPGTHLRLWTRETG
jgi:hypothetical protein